MCTNTSRMDGLIYNLKAVSQPCTNYAFQRNMAALQLLNVATTIVQSMFDQKVIHRADVINLSRASLPYSQCGAVTR